jgi:uncharacterized protein YhbP (UPF0306 family)
MEVKDLIKKYLKQSRMMQIATLSGDQPWICTVYYIEDDDLNLYWLSYPTRRHSKEIEEHNKVAIAVAVKFDKPIIGIQAEGVVEIEKDAELVAKVMQDYVAKYDSGEDFYEHFKAGTNKHQLYKFKPTKYKVFDEMFYKDNPELEWTP